MMRWRQLVAAVVAAVVALLGVSPSAAAAPTAVVGLPTGEQVAGPVCGQSDLLVYERGQLLTNLEAHVPLGDDAGDGGLSGTRVRPTANPAIYDYDATTQLVQAAHVADGVAPALGATDGEPRPVSGCLVAAEDGTTLYRGMRGAADGTPELGSSAKTLGARPGIDIPVDEGGMVRPGTGGMSVNDSPTGMPEYRRPPSFGGSGKDLNMYCISSCDLGPGLRYVPDAGGHGFLEPAWEMPFEEYQGYLHGTAGSWSEVLP